MTDQFGIVANVHGDSRFREGARVWIADASDLGRPMVSGLAPSGQTIRHRIKRGALSNFRAAWIPPNAKAYAFGGRPEAEQIAINLTR
jgi:hypothetical protein